MKKIYLFAGALCLTAGAFAQNLNTERASRVKSFNEARPVLNAERAEGDLIWEDDFSTPGDWSIGNEGTPQDWVIGTAAPTGSFSSTYGTLASTTAANNFALYDSDFLGSDATSQDAWVAWNGMTIVTTGLAAITLEFQSLYSHYQGACYVEFSIDGGNTWPHQYQVHQDVAGNTASDNPTLISLNVSAIGNQADVKIRFRYIGGWDYAWMVDDVKLIEAFDNDLSMGGIGQRAGNDSLDIYAIPASQKAAFPGWYFGADVNNIGGQDQANSRLNVTVDNGSGYSEDSPMMTLVSGTTDTFEIATPFATTTDGNYNAIFSADMDNVDAITANDNDTMNLTVGGLIYARDNGISTSAISNVSSQPGQPLKIGNYFEIFADMTFQGVDVGLSNNALNVGQVFSVEIQKYNSTSDMWEYLTESSGRTITAGMNGAMNTIILNDEVNVTAGDYILALARHDGGVDLDADGNPDEVAFLMAQNTIEGSVLGYTADGGSFQLTEPQALMVRLNEDPTLAINENNVELTSSVYPNPANNETTINYTLVESAKVSVQIVDITGKVVYSNAIGNVAAGSYNEVVNTSNLSNGVYYYNFNVNGNVSTQKIVVSHK